MSKKYPGGLIRKTPPTITPPVDGEGGSAPGVWTLEQASYYTKQGTWPLPVLPKPLYSWGAGSYGQLGLNDTNNRSSPTQIGSDTNWLNISNGGASFLLAVKTDGTLWSWGENIAGDLGHNDSIYRSSPTQIGSLTNWLYVNQGSTFSMAIKTDGTLWSWGNNNAGMLGLNSTISRSSPVQVGSLTNWSKVDCGTTHALAIKTDGTLWSWGNNGNGQLGLGDWDTTTNRSSPVQVGSDTNWLSIAGGGAFSLATKTTGTLWSWGANGDGQLGNGDTSVYRSSPTQVGALTNWKDVYASLVAVSFAIKTDGTLWAWGKNSSGELGLNDVIARSSPVQVGTLTNWKLAVSCYSSAAIKTDGTLWAWGNNSSGAVGDNTVVNRSSPVQVGSSTNWNKLGAGQIAFAAIKLG